MSHQHYPQPYQYREDDEIDLFELAEKLWSRKGLIIAITVVITLIATVVALMLPSTWRSEVHAHASSTSNLDIYNNIREQLNTNNEMLALSGENLQIGKNDFPPLTSDDAYNAFYRHLTSRSTQRYVFSTSGLGDISTSELSDTVPNKLLAATFENFKANLVISSPHSNSGSGNTFTVSYTTNDPEFSASLINDYLLPATTDRTRQELTANIASKIKGEINNFEKRIVLIESRFIEQVRLKTLKLEKALKLAKAGNIIEPVNLNAGLLDNTGSNQFLLGTDILSTQLDIQKSEAGSYRLISLPQVNDTDKPLLPNVAALFLAKQSLKIIDTSLEGLKPIIIDEPAQVPTSPIKPKKTLIIALGVVLGGMLGVFVALINIAIAGRKERKQTKKAVIYNSTL